MINIESACVSLGEEVKRRRHALGISLEELAARSDLLPNYIGQIENGRRDASLSTIAALANGLEAQPGELFRGRTGLSPAASEMARLFDQMPEVVQEGVMMILRDVVGRMGAKVRALGRRKR
jgi:transcriptional regulator with XRE-family HTH domain